MTFKHTVALISIIAQLARRAGRYDFAYDLLGGEHGPLRTLTRAVTHDVLFKTGYGLRCAAPLRWVLKAA